MMQQHSTYELINCSINVEHDDTPVTVNRYVTVNV